MPFRSAIVYAFIAAALCSPLVVSAATGDCAVFARNLKLGMSGDDVKALQVFLNQSDATRVATDGPGSSGSETAYFGTKTFQAAVAFQELYVQDVLAPVGLVHGSGFVGTLTRGKILTLCAQSPVAPATSQATSIIPVSGKLALRLGQLATTSEVVSATYLFRMQTRL